MEKRRKEESTSIINTKTHNVALFFSSPFQIATCDSKVPTEMTTYSDFLALTCHFFRPASSGSHDPTLSQSAAQEWPQSETQNRPQLNVASAAVLDSLREDKRSVKKRVLSRGLNLKAGLSISPSTQNEIQSAQNSR